MCLIDPGLDSNIGVRPEDFSEEAAGLELRFRAALFADFVADAHSEGHFPLAQVPRFFNPKYFAKTRIVSNIKMLYD